MNGKVAIADRRAQITANAATIGANAKGDTLALRLDAVPEGGLGPLMGTFEMRGGTLAFVSAPRAEPPPPPAPN